MTKDLKEKTFGLLTAKKSLANPNKVHFGIVNVRAGAIRSSLHRT